MITLILSQHINPEEETRCTGIYHGLLHNGKISVYAPSDSTTRIKQMVLPQTPFRLDQLGSTDISAWKLVITWLQFEIGQNPLIVIDHDHPFRELMLYANKLSGLQFGLRFGTQITKVDQIGSALLGNSKINLFMTPEIEDDFCKKYIGPYHSANSESDLQNQREDIFQKHLNSNALHSAAEKSTNGDVPLKLLLVSYYSGACRSVATQRINYWFDEISKISKGKIDIHLATAINQDEERENLHIVPDHNIASLLGNGNDFPDWGRQFIATERKNAKSFNTMSYYWRYALEQYFEDRDDHFDVVIITGNPFSCFDFAAFAKRHWHSRVILDYRDPFANNPRILYRPEARELARYTERGYNFQADAVLTVNNECVDLLEVEEDIDVVVIPNGFNEQVSKKVHSKKLSNGVVNFVHAGSFYYYGSPKHLMSSMNLDKHRFHHVGNLSGIEPDLLDSEVLIKHGQKPYPDTLAIIGGADCGIVYLSESNFESSTKVFDYIAMGLDILLCTQGTPNTGALNSILEGYEGVYWCYNTPESTADFLSTYQPTLKKKSETVHRYSRNYSTKILINNIYNLFKN